MLGSASSKRLTGVARWVDAIGAFLGTVGETDSSVPEELEGDFGAEPAMYARLTSCDCRENTVAALPRLGASAHNRSAILSRPTAHQGPGHDRAGILPCTPSFPRLLPLQRLSCGRCGGICFASESPHGLHCFSAPSWCFL